MTARGQDNLGFDDAERGEGLYTTCIYMRTGKHLGVELGLRLE